MVAHRLTFRPLLRALQAFPARIASTKECRSSSAALFQMATGCWISQAIYVAAKLGITDMLKGEPQSCVALAAATGSDAPSLFRLMRASASMGVFSRVREIPSLFPASQIASRLILLHLLGRLGRW